MLSIQNLMQEAKVSPRNGRKPTGLRRGEEKAAFAAVLDTLPEETRLVLGLRYYEALKPAAIAGILGLAVDQVQALLAEGLRAVLGRLEDAHPIDGPAAVSVARSAERGKRR
jgi:DNA-directed RNA polymerase specialized sigma24 family protein